MAQDYKSKGKATILKSKARKSKKWFSPIEANLRRCPETVWEKKNNIGREAITSQEK